MRNCETPTYRVWANIKRKCYPSLNQYSELEERGIKMCDRWRKSFADFLEDIGEKPTPNSVIIRKDLSKDFCKDNCVWGLPEDLYYHRINTIHTPYGNMKELCKKYNIKYSTLYKRFKKWKDIEKSLNKPVRKYLTNKN